LAQALGSAIMLYSRILLYRPNNQSLIQSILAIRLLLKLGAAPCHFWFPSTITSINWINCLILCTWQKLGPLALLIFPFTNTYQLKPILIAVASLNAIIGGLLGINQSHIRAILAYSSITHIGWVIGGTITNSALIPITYFTIYSAIIAPIFIILNTWKSLSFSQIPQMVTNSISISIIFTLTILSLGGLPPLTGFIPKWLTIITLRNINWILVLTLLLGRLINLYFYLNLTFNILTLSTLSRTKNEFKRHTTLPLIISLNSLGIFPILIYAMTLLHKSQRYWYIIHNLRSLRRGSWNRNKNTNSIWIITTWIISRKGSII
jgi:NADH-ubiquinone oxidoreductase chain 2